MDFWDYIFKDPDGKLEGYVRVALRHHNGKFQQNFLKWPQDKNKLVQLVQAAKKGDVYFCPALYANNSSGHKGNVLGSWVVWVDQDAPGQGAARPAQDAPAGLVVASGSEGHRHLYWRSEEFLAPVLVESWNLELCTKYDGDPSGWDANQLLRVPGTINHKKRSSTPVKLLVQNPDVVLPVPETFTASVVEVRPANEVPVADILVEKKFDGKIKSLLQQSRAEDRSRDLYALSCLLFEANCTVDEVFSLLCYADARWGKFASRDDKEARIADIVGRTADRKPSVSLELGRPSAETQIQPVGWRSVASSENTISWVVEGILRQGGFLLVTGDAGVGKSTLLLNMGARLCLQASNFLGANCSNEGPRQRILFGSHEMDGAELNYFLGHLSQTLASEQLDVLEEYFEFLPFGHAVYLDTEQGREFYDKLLAAGEYTGLIVDTLGASVSASLSDESVARTICDWVDSVRSRYGIWVAVLHHPRKAAPGTRTGSRLDDTFGSRIFVDRANTVLHLSRGKGPNTFHLHSHKSRLSKSSTYKVLTKTDQLWFDLKEEVPLGETSVMENHPVTPVKFEFNEDAGSSDDLD